MEKVRGDSPEVHWPLAASRSPLFPGTQIANTSERWSTQFYSTIQFSAPIASSYAIWRQKLSSAVKLTVNEKRDRNF